jgi:hypothetical protein
MTVAGHYFEDDGVCRRTTRREDVEVVCGMTRRQLRNIVYEYRALGKTAIDELDFAHTRQCTQSEWLEATAMVDEEDRVFESALAQVCGG